MSRASAIKDKISYAEYQRQKLMDEMFRAKKESVEPKFIVHTSGEILSLARECFDYCAQDIMEDIIVADTNNSYLINRYHSGKLRVYFPFYKRQLTGKKDIFQELKVVNKNLHSHLYSLAAKI